MGVCALLASCLGGNRELTEVERSDFSVYVDSLDPALSGNWFSRMGVSADADTLLAYLRQELPKNGLDTTAFHLLEIAGDLSIVHQLAFDSIGQSINEVLPRLDRHLNEAFTLFSLGQRYGFVNPDKLFNHLDSNSRRDGYTRLFDEETADPDRQLVLGKLTASDRIRFLKASAPDGYVYKMLKTRIQQTTDKGMRRILAVNMERCRWQMVRPQETERQVLVNIAAQQLWAVCPDSVLNMRICCGAKATKTPLLHSAISYLQVNPDWIIPQNIIDNDVARHGGDSAYFARNHYYIVERSTGDTLQPRTIGPEQLKSGRYRVGQTGGAHNSLGRIVFRFPNNFAVYLHDTNNRGAFNRDRRTLSHGCVRVQKPYELACFLLPGISEWDRDCLRISMDLKPKTDRGKDYLEAHADDPRPLRLMTYHGVSPHVPVYIIYYTVYPSPETGVLEFFPDVYGYDQVISREMGALLM